MVLRKRHLLCLKIQGNLPDLLTVSLQPFFSKLAAICGVAISNHVTGSLIDLVRRGWLIAESSAYFFSNSRFNMVEYIPCLGALANRGRVIFSFAVYN